MFRFDGLAINREFISKSRLPKLDDLFTIDLQLTSLLMPNTLSNWLSMNAFIGDSTTTERKNNPMTPAFKQQKKAVSAVFFANGLIVGCWALLVPIIIANLGIAESDMGLIILAGGGSAIVALATSPMLIKRFGVRGVITLSGAIMAVSVFAIQQAEAIVIGIVFVLLMMSALAAQDVAMNTNAVDLEQQSGRANMSAFHAFWSAGAMIGALAGGSIIAHLGSASLALLAGVGNLIIVLLTFRFLEAKHIDTEGTGAQPRFQVPRMLLPWLFGLMAFVGFVSEGAVIDWSALFFRNELAATVEMSGLAFGGFSFSMMLARFAGDSIRDRLGDQKLLLVSIILAGVGMTFVSFSTSSFWASVGFFFAGFGNANIVPIAFSGAGAIKGLPKGMGIATATFCGYAGLLAAPALLGIVGEHFSFRVVFGLMAALLLALLFLVPAVKAKET